jgi:RHS repeat-associated protein
MTNKVFANSREVACKAASGKSIAATPDVCFTPPLTPATPPGVPVPYPNTGMASDTTAGSKTVDISGEEVMLKNKSYFSKSTGDEAGSAPKKGVVTSQITGKVYFTAWSMDVKIEGENVDRHLDLTTHNHASSMPGNTPPMAYIDEMAMPSAGGEPDEPCPLAAAEGSPVNPVLGVKVLSGEEDLDFMLPGPLPLEWQRFYRSNNFSDGWFGQGWGSLLELFLERTEDGGIDFIDSFGRRIKFPGLRPGQEFYSPYEQLTLVRPDMDVFALRASDGGIFWFGKLLGTRYSLLRISDTNGNAICLEPEPDENRIYVGCSGKQLLELGFDARGRLCTITELRGAGNGRTPRARLRAAPGPIARVSLMRYIYDECGDLRRVINRAGECVREFSWQDHLMIRQMHGGAFEAHYEYSGTGHDSKVVRHWDNVGRSWAFDYRAESTQVTDQDGRVTTYHFDKDKRWTGVTDASGQFTGRCLDRFGNVRALIDPAENITETEFDERSNPIKVIDPTGAVTDIEWHPRLSVPVAVTDPLGKRIEYAYDERGNLVGETGADGAQTQYQLDERGLVVAITDAHGHVIELNHDERGQLTRYTDCSGKTTTLAYDENGWLIRLINALGEATTFGYDQAGRLSTQILADGSAETYSYDWAGRLTAITAGEGETIRYVYDPDGLLSARIDPLGHELLYRYDSARRLVALVNENGATYRFAYDALDRLVEETAFDGKRTRYTYDEAGFLTDRVDAADTPGAIAIKYDRDALGRLLVRTTANGRAEYAYNGVGQIVEATNADSQLRMKYDRAGRIASEEVTIGSRVYTVSHRYDALGNRVETRLPDGRKIGCLYYGSGYAHQVRFGTAAICDIERDDLHREVSRTQGSVTSYRAYDAAGRLIRQRVARESAIGSAAVMPMVGSGVAPIERSYRYDLAGRLIECVDRGKKISYSCDAIGRLTRFNNERFAFDPAHNLIPAAGSADTRSQGAIKNNRLSVFEDKRYQYDDHGRVVEKRAGSHFVARLTWNDDHQLVEAETHRLGSAQRTRYIYDAMGRRLAKFAPSGTIWFVWDGDRLLQEYRSDDTYTFIYEPQGTTPLAQVYWNTSGEAQGDPAMGADARALDVDLCQLLQSGQRIYYYHCDQIGLPRELTNAYGEVVWEASYKAWGRLREERSPRDGGTEGASSFHQPIRFQGQYEDEETGLFYNRFRYYDPDVARFLTSDPAGLPAGENLYAYAPNPTEWIDPLGLNIRSDLYPSRVRKPTRQALEKKATGSDGKMRCGKCNCVITSGKAGNATVAHNPPLVTSHNTKGWDGDQKLRNNLYNETATDLECIDCQKKQGGSMSHCQNYRNDIGPNFKPRGAK